jgi:hypothetical protein
MRLQDQEGLSPEEKEFLEGVEKFVNDSLVKYPEWKPVANRFEVSLGFAHENVKLREGEEDMYFGPEDPNIPPSREFIVRIYPKRVAHELAAKAARERAARAAQEKVAKGAGAAQAGADPCCLWCFKNGIFVCCAVC